MTNLPDRKTTEAVSWWFDDDPQSLLAKTPAELRAIGIEVALVAAPRMAEIKRYVGLVCWAMRAKVVPGEYGKWVEGYAEMVGVTVRTLGEWRSRAEALADIESPFTSPRKPKTAGQSTQLEETSKVRAPIPVTFTEAPAKKSEGAAPLGEVRPVAPSGPLPEPSPVAPQGVDDAGSLGTPSGEADQGGHLSAASPDPLAATPAGPPAPSGVAATRLPPILSDADGLRWLSSKTVKDWRSLPEPTGPAIRYQLGVAAHALGRSPGRVIRPADREAPEPGNCLHPKDRLKRLTYGNFCGLCNARVA